MITAALWLCLTRGICVEPPNRMQQRRVIQQLQQRVCPLEKKPYTPCEWLVRDA